MNISNQHKIVLFFAVILTVLPSNAVRVSLAEAELFRAGMRGFHWALLLGPAASALTVYQQDFKNKELIKDDADKDVAAFVRTTLKEQGYDPSLVDSLKVQKSHCLHYYTFYGFYADSISFVIEVPFNSYMLGKTTIDAQARSIWKGAICHEGAHIVNKDSEKKLGFSAVAPVLGHLVVRGSTLPLKIALDHWLSNRAQSTTLKIARGAGYVSSALIKMYVGSILELAYSKYREHMADEEVRKRVKDPEVLHVIAENFKSHHKQTQYHLSRMTFEDVLPSEYPRDMVYQGNLKDLFERCPLFYEIVVPTNSKQFVFNTHPSYFNRAQRFEQTAKELERKLAGKELQSQNDSTK